MLILDESAVTGEIVSVELHGELKLCCSTKARLGPHRFYGAHLEEPLSGASLGNSIRTWQQWYWWGERGSSAWRDSQIKRVYVVCKQSVARERAAWTNTVIVDLLPTCEINPSVSPRQFFILQTEVSLLRPLAGYCWFIFSDFKKKTQPQTSMCLKPSVN